jgi:cell migration-inducing and hyaluronan-binding protein
VITLDQKLEYMHYGQVTFGVDERAEVGMISRNIKLQASADSEKTFSGGHVMAMAGSDNEGLGCRVLLEWASTRTLRGIRSTGIWLAIRRGNTFENSAIHDTFQPLRDGAWHEQYSR